MPPFAVYRLPLALGPEELIALSVLTLVGIDTIAYSEFRTR